MSFWDIFGSFSPLTTQKIKILKLKKAPGDVIILYICTINDNHMMYGSWDMESNRQISLSFWTTICSFTPPYRPRKSKFLKNEKNTWRYYHFTNVYHKQQSYDVWFLRYEVQRTEFFVILDHFLAFYPPNNPKNRNFEKLRKKPVILSFYTCVPWTTIIWCMAPEIESMKDKIFCHFGPFFAFLPQ